MSVKSVIKDIDKGRKGRAVAHIGGADVGFIRKGARRKIVRGPVGMTMGRMCREIILNIAKGGKLDIRTANGDKEPARASAKTFRLKLIKRMITERKNWGKNFPKKLKEAKILNKYRKENPEVFV